MISREGYEICRKRFKDMWEWIAALELPITGKDGCFGKDGCC